MTKGEHLHSYSVDVKWTGNTGQGTRNYKAYARSHEIGVDGKPTIPGSSDPAFRGDRSRYNPEELLIASLSTCHMLWYLHFCAISHIVVTDYVDQSVGQMVETDDGSGHFVAVELRPVVTVTPDSDIALAKQLHDKAHHACFIANSVNFPVTCKPVMQQETVLNS